MLNHDEDQDPIARIRTSPDFPMVDALIVYLRSNTHRMTPTREIAAAIGCEKRVVYGVVKIARKYLELTSGECIANIRRQGYKITHDPRAFLFESVKSGRRRDQLKSIEDIELYVQQQAIVHLGHARLAMGRDMKALTVRHERNAALSDIASADASTPWDALGLTDPNSGQN